MSEAKTILVVDDDHDLRAGVQTMLQQHGYRTLEADDGMEAQKMINGHRPDLVILDMMMPRWGGFLVLEHFQHKADAPPFIMITAESKTENVIAAKKAGVSNYIVKPFNAATLKSKIDAVFADRPHAA